MDKIKDISFSKLFNEVEITEELISEEEEIVETMKVYNHSDDIENIDIKEEERLAVNLSKEINIPDIRKKDSIQKQLDLWRDTGEDIVIADKIFHLAASGLLRKEIKKTLKINIRLWNEMLRDNNSVYSIAIREGEPLGIYNVVDALQMSATGFEYFEYKKGERNGKPFHEIHKRYSPPNYNSIKLYLSKKLPAIWGDNNDLNININKKETLSVEKMKKLSPDMLKQLMLIASEEDGDVIDVQ